MTARVARKRPAERRGVVSARPGEPRADGLVGWTVALGLLALLSAIVAATSVWLVLGHPAVVAQAVSEGSWSTMFRELVRALPRTLSRPGEMSALPDVALAWPGGWPADAASMRDRVPPVGPLLLVVFGVRMMRRSRDTIRRRHHAD